MDKSDGTVGARWRTLAGAAVFCAGLGLLGGCGGGGEKTPSGSTAPVTPTPVGNTSYAHYKGVGLVPQTLPPGNNGVRAYGDFAGNGRLDYFRATLTYNVSLPPEQATPSVFEFYTRQSDGSLVPSTTLLPQAAGCIHPRKAIVADFNGDGRPDVFVACHGYDASPFPGEKSKVVLSQPNGSYAISDASADVGFHHSATAADLNGDGKPDVVVVNNFDAQRAYVLINDGSGHFTREGNGRLPTALQGGNYFSVELADVNEDGWLDLLIAGHEWQGAPTSVFINPGNNQFGSVARTTLPAVANEGVVLDFTLTGTGTSRAIWLVRTSGGDGTFYQSRVVQKVAYPSLTSTVALNARPAKWIPWLIPATVNGAAVVTSDDEADAVSFAQ